jgi:hypothetical protein
MRRSMLLLLTLVFPALIAVPVDVFTENYPVIDTHQTTCYDNQDEIPPPAPGAPFHGQDAQYDGLLPQHLDNGDGTVSDLVTGLMWLQADSAHEVVWNGDGEPAARAVTKQSIAVTSSPPRPCGAGS